MFHPNGQLVFVSNELDASLSTFRFDADGTLTLLHSVSVLPAGFRGTPWAADLHLTPDKLKGTVAAATIPFDMVSGRRFQPFPRRYLEHHLTNDFLNRPLS